MMYRYLLFLFFLSYHSIGFSQTSLDTIQVHFDLNVSTVSESDKELLKVLVSKNIIPTDANLTVIGYADYLGSENRNLELSEKRANNVSQYLVSLGINKDLIKQCTGKGAVKREEKDKNGFPPDRRVDVVVETRKVETPPPPPPVPEKPKVPPTPLASTRRGASFVLENFYFNSNRHTIKPESLPVLDQLYQDLVENPRIKIQIEGHVCCVGNGRSDAAASFEPPVLDALDDDVPPNAPVNESEPPRLRYKNNTLSRNRARYICEYLVKKGISPDRIKYIGYGNLRPAVSPERTREDEAKNRRVEIRILER